MPILNKTAPAQRLTLGISACLTGEKVRYNGAHKRAGFCLRLLDQIADLKPVCPEVAIGLGTPRQPIRLVATDRGIRARGSDDPSHDVTDQLSEFGRRWGEAHDELDGVILTQKSPSCGMERVKIYRENGYPASHDGSGLFAAALRQAQPLLPIEEEGRLHDARLRENFFTRCYTYRAWRDQVAANPSHKALVAFHSQCKYLLMAHDPRTCTELGRLIANRPADGSIQALCQRYISRCMGVLAKPASRRGHTNTLLHLLGYLKGKLDPRERHELLEGIHGYHQGQLPLVVPLRMMRHYLRLRGTAYVQQQRYLQPHPEALGLHNAI